MSSKKDCRLSTTAEPENPIGGGSTITTYSEDPLDRIYEPSEDSDWEVAFRESIRPTSTSSTPAPSMTWKGEDTGENMDLQYPNTQEYNNQNNIASAYSEENLPIELNENSRVIELQVPVVSIPTDSLAPLWSQEFISGFSSPRYTSVPLYVAEGREDPNIDEGIDEPSSPLDSTPMISGQVTEHQTSSQDPQPEEFIDRCHVLQWVINDSDITPNVLGTHFLAPSTVTSGAFNQTRATTADFITPLKQDSVYIPEPSLVLSPSPSVKSEMEDSDWEPHIRSETSGHNRKRGRPAKPLGSRTITPMPPSRTYTAVSDLELSDSSVIMTDDEVSAQKYRRMRDLNNMASRRCRETRKEKAEEAERELHTQLRRNLQLKRIVAKMEAQMKVMKRRILTEVRNSSSRGIESGASQGPSQGREGYFMDSFLSGATGDLPDIDVMWSRM